MQTQISLTSTQWALLSTANYSTWPYMEHTFSSIIHNLGGMLNNWSELGGLSAQPSFACSWWICGIQCTLQEERGNIVLSCVSVFTAHSLINYSAEPSDCDLQFWEEGPRLPSLDDGSVTALAALIVLHFHAPAGLALTHCISWNTLKASLWGALML